jgi:hypothetical protein
MAAEAQIFANRRNALCSTGPRRPRTAEGKERASQNAVKHGLLSKQPILHCEDRAMARLSRACPAECDRITSSSLHSQGPFDGCWLVVAGRGTIRSR